MTQAKLINKKWEWVTLPLASFRNIQKIHSFMDEEWTIKKKEKKNKKYRSLKMCPFDIILKFKNIVKFN